MTWLYIYLFGVVVSATAVLFSRRERPEEHELGADVFVVLLWPVTVLVVAYIFFVIYVLDKIPYWLLKKRGYREVDDGR